MKTLDIEKALRWTYCEQLPKATSGGDGGPGYYAPGSMGLLRLQELGTTVDAPLNAYGVVAASDWGDCEPHPDAIVIWRAVQGLANFELALPDNWSPIEDWGDLGALGALAIARAMDRATIIDADGRRHLRREPVRLIEKHAILGGCPDWHGEVPTVRTVRAVNGAPKWFRRIRRPTAWDGDGAVIATGEVEVDGFDLKRRRPYDDAYQKQELAPDPVSTIIGRAEYEVWLAALDVVVEEIAGELDDHVVTPCLRPLRPWEDGEVIGPRIFGQITKTGT